MNTLTLYEDMKKKHPYTEITMYKAGIKGDNRVNNALIGMAKEYFRNFATTEHEIDIFFDRMERAFSDIDVKIDRTGIREQLMVWLDKK